MFTAVGVTITEFRCHSSSHGITLTFSSPAFFGLPLFASKNIGRRSAPTQPLRRWPPQSSSCQRESLQYNLKGSSSIAVVFRRHQTMRAMFERRLVITKLMMASRKQSARSRCGRVIAAAQKTASITRCTSFFITFPQKIHLPIYLLCTFPSDGNVIL